MQLRNARRRGMSLIELLVVVTLLGLFASAAMMRFGRDTFADNGARSEARLLSLAMLHAQRAAIRTGDSHGIVFQGPASNVLAWTVMQKLPNGSRVVVEAPRELADGVSVVVNVSEMWFSFEGAGSTMFQAQLSGPNRSYEVQAKPHSRMIQTLETTR